MKDTLNLIVEGFKSLNIDEEYKEKAVGYLKLWLSDKQFSEYVPQIEHLVSQEKWDLLLDSFYQVIPFGTAGRRGMVGIGPNRINPWTIQASAQGHSQYLLKRFGEEAKERGIVISYDVRQYLEKGVYDDSKVNPIKDMSCKDLAEQVACVYSANGIKVRLFSQVTSTPEMSFMVRHLKAVAGDMISASHNPPEFNGKKVVDETGGQLIPPHDEQLVDVVVNEVKEIKSIDFKDALDKGLIDYVTEEDHQAYLKAVQVASINREYRSAKVYFSPFCGTAINSVYPAMKKLGFDITMDEASGKPDPLFSSIKYNLPNPELEEAYENLLDEADKIGADIILTADPDADRIGLMSKEKNGWQFFNGNEIFVLTASYLISEFKKNGKLKNSHKIVKTVVTTNLLTKMADRNGIEIIGDLMVGIKYVAEEMKKLEKAGNIDEFLIGGEESHGQIMGNYCHDKDSCSPAILLAELASKLKDEDKTLSQYLDDIYIEYGYVRNYLNEIRLPGAEGMSSIAKIQSELRDKNLNKFGDFKIISRKDYREGEPFLSETDKVARNVLSFNLETRDEKTESILVTVRPSGTEPKNKIYIEICRKESDRGTLSRDKEETEKLKDEIEKAVIKHCYKILDIDFPDRGFLLFWQLPAQNKMKYFEVEPKIEKLKEIEDLKEREDKLMEILSFLGGNPIQKVNKAFEAKYRKGVKEYLDL